MRSSKNLYAFIHLWLQICHESLQPVAALLMAASFQKTYAFSFANLEFPGIQVNQNIGDSIYASLRFLSYVVKLCASRGIFTSSLAGWAFGIFTWQQGYTAAIQPRAKELFGKKVCPTFRPSLPLRYHYLTNGRDRSSLAYLELRLILAKLLFHFDLEICPESKNWIDQNVYIGWDKKSLMVRLTDRVTWNQTSALQR